MMPFHLNIEELTVYQPLIEAIQHHNLIPAYNSLEEVEKVVTKLFDTKSPDDLVIATDFTKMDQHFNEGMQYISKECISRLLTPMKQNNL